MGGPRRCPLTPDRNVYRTPDDIRVLDADEQLDLGDVVADWSPLVGDFFA